MSVPRNLLPFPPEYAFKILNQGVGNCSKILQSVLSHLELKWQFRPATSTVVGLAMSNVWSRAARRKGNSQVSETSDEPALGFKIQFAARGADTKFVVRWLQGSDSVLFESFCGMLKRKLES